MQTYIFNFSSIQEAFSVRNFFIYTVGNATSLIGMWAQRLSVGWLIWDLTESAAWLGAIAMAEFLPILFLTPFGGVIADRYNRLSIAKIAQIVVCLISLVLCILTFLNQITPFILILIMLIAGTTNALNQASRVSLVVNMVSRKLMTPAIAINSVIFNLARIVGPAIGGLLISTTSVSWAFLFSTITFIILLFALNMILMPKETNKEGNNQFQINDLYKGITFITNNNSVFIIVLITGVNSILARPIIELLPGFSDTVFNSGPQGLAILTSSMGIGAIISSIWLAQRGTLNGLSNIVFIGVLINSIAIILFSLSADLFTGAILLGISGFTQACTGTGTQTLIQSFVPDSLRGRVMSVWLVIGRGGPAFGALIIGIVAEFTGFPLPIMAGGFLTALVLIKYLSYKNSVALALET
ncbi:MAG: MFS transporter [Pseudomonadota bacterium]|nr:MFS transporter [Pseudomonadota bacterium]